VTGRLQKGDATAKKKKKKQKTFERGGETVSLFSPEDNDKEVQDWEEAAKLKVPHH